MKNEIKAGYHKTEAGWIPKDWDCKSLECVCNNGGKYGAAASSVDYSPDLPRYIRITEITDGGQLSPIDIKSIRNENAEGYELKEGDFLIARTGATVGKTYLHRTKGNFAFAGYLIRFVPNPERLLGSFLSYFTQSGKYWSWVRLTIHTGAQPNINAREYSGLYIPLPSVDEQRSIIQILSTWDHAIERVQRLIEAKQLQKKGLMQGLLSGKLRFSRFSNSIKEQRVIHVEWGSYRLDELVTFHNGYGFPEKEQGGFEGDIPFIKVSDMLNIENQKYICSSNNYVSSSTIKAYKWKPASTSSIVFAKVGEALYKNRRRILTRDTIIDNNMMAIKALPERVLDQYLYFVMLTVDFSKFAFPGALPSINQSELGKITINLPGLEEQKEIIGVLEKIDCFLLLLNKKLALLQKQKKGLMQKLLTGEIRVNI